MADELGVIALSDALSVSSPSIIHACLYFDAAHIGALEPRAPNRFGCPTSPIFGRPRRGRFLTCYP